MIKETIMYTIECDGCGEMWTGDDIIAYADAYAVIQAAFDDDWAEDDDGRHYCPDCAHFEFED